MKTTLTVIDLQGNEVEVKAAPTVTAVGEKYDIRRYGRESHYSRDVTLSTGETTQVSEWHSVWTRDLLPGGKPSATLLADAMRQVNPLNRLSQ